MLTHRLGHGLHGSVGKFVANASRTYPSGYRVGAGEIDRNQMWKVLIDNASIREDAAREIDATLLTVSRRSLVAWQDAAGVATQQTEKGLGTTEWAYDRIAPVGQASQSMNILNMGDMDLADFSRAVIPVPSTASRFRLDARHRASGDVDTVNIEEHSRAVAEKLEDTITNGSAVVMDGNALPGYTNLSCREQLSFSAGPWTSSTGFAGAIDDVINARAALRANGFMGPYNLYLPVNFDGEIDKDYSTVKGDRTLRERLLALDGLSAIKIAPALPDDNVVLVQMTRSVVHIVSGQQLTVVTWDEFGGLATDWVVIAVQAPALKCSNARAPLSQGVLPALTLTSGIAHLS